MVNLVTTKRSDERFVVCTEGLQTFGHPEVSVDVSESMLKEAEQLLEHISNYLLNERRTIYAGETMSYGYWLIKFQKAERNDILEIWEYSADASTFIKGGNLTLGFWKDQHFVCSQHLAAFTPPRPDKLTVISAGVIEGLPVQGIRYSSPDHMSGWWITTDLYDGNIKSLRQEHTYHVTAARPDLAKYLALPNGFRFNFSVGEEVWFDDKTLN